MPLTLTHSFVARQLESYKRSIAQKKGRIPPIPPQHSTPASRDGGGGGGAASSSSAASKHPRWADHDAQSVHSPERRDAGGGGDGDQRAKRSKKGAPLYQRLAAQAKAHAEREEREKVRCGGLCGSVPGALLIVSPPPPPPPPPLTQPPQMEKYNLIRMQKAAAKAPTREEVKERERALEMDLDRARHDPHRAPGPHGPPAARRKGDRARDSTPPDFLGAAPMPTPVPMVPAPRPTPKFKAKISPLHPSSHHMRRIDDRGPHVSHSTGNSNRTPHRGHHPPVDPDSRPVAFNSEARLDPFDDDGGAGLFSPLSVGSVTSSVGMDRRARPAKGGLKKLGIKPRGPRLAFAGADGDGDGDDDDDDDSRSSGLVSKLTDWLSD